MNILVDKHLNLPSYIQVVEQIKDQIFAGELKKGEKLPTERELSIQTNVSRGTIVRAYDILREQGLLNSRRRNGTFVAGVDSAQPSREDELADHLTDKLLLSLFRMNLSLREVETLINSKIKQRIQTNRNIQVAIVDCNMETLGLISGQLYNISDVDITELLLSDIIRYPQKLTYGYDLILTTRDHYLQVIDVVPNLSNIIFKVAIVPSQKVQYQLSCIKESMSVGIWCISQEFASAAYSHIISLSQGTAEIDFQLVNTTSTLADFVKGKDVIILPYDYFIGGNPSDREVIQTFIKNNGTVIQFEYCIDQGSLTHITQELSLCRERRKAFLERHPTVS